MLRKMEDLRKRVLWGVENLKKCHVGGGVLDKNKLKDAVMFSFSMHYVSEGVKKGLLESNELYAMITEETKEEQTCQQ